MKKILIIGAGAMGSAFSVPCLENKNDVSLIGTFLENDLIKSLKEKNNYHPALNINLPNHLNIERHDQIGKLTQDEVDVVVAGISSVGIEWFANEISKFYKKKNFNNTTYKGIGC